MAKRKDKASLQAARKLGDEFMSMIAPTYDLRRGKVVVLPPTYKSLILSAKKMERGDFRLWRTQKGKRWVSTVFLWSNHGFPGGDPVLFESYYYDGKHGDIQERYCSKAAAWAGHQKWCRTYRLGTPEKAQRFKPFTTRKQHATEA